MVINKSREEKKHALKSDKITTRKKKNRRFRKESITNDGIQMDGCFILQLIKTDKKNQRRIDVNARHKIVVLSCCFGFWFGSLFSLTLAAEQKKKNYKPNLSN